MKNYPRLALFVVLTQMLTFSLSYANLSDLNQVLDNLQLSLEDFKTNLVKCEQSYYDRPSDKDLREDIDGAINVLSLRLAIVRRNLPEYHLVNSSSNTDIITPISIAQPKVDITNVEAHSKEYPTFNLVFDNEGSLTSIISEKTFETWEYKKSSLSTDRDPKVAPEKIKTTVYSKVECHKI